MKILMLGWELPPHISGGMGIACYNLCKALYLRGLHIEFVVPYRAEHPNIDFMKIYSGNDVHPKEITNFGIYDTNFFQYKGGTSNGEAQSSHLPKEIHRQRLGYMESVEKIADNSNYDAIHAHDWLTFDAALLAKKKLKKPLIVHIHATEFDRSGENFGNPLVHEIEYNAMTLADKIIAVSQATKRLIVKDYGIPEDKIEVVHNSINPEDYAPLDSLSTYNYLKNMKEKGYKVVLSASRLTVQKGLTHFLQAAHLALQKNNKLLFLICGSGDQYHELIQLSADLGISKNIIFAGWVSGEKLRESYAIADMFVMSSVSEPFGLTALEATAHNVATLVSRQSGVSEVLRNSLKFDYWNHQKLANEIIALANYPALGSLMTQNALQEFRQFSWSDVAKKCTDIYKKTTEAAVV